MLPFLKPKQSGVGGVAVTVRKPDGSQQIDESEDSQVDEALGACAADLIRGVHAKDEESVVAALKSAFEILDSQPHEEGEHTNEEEFEGEEE